MILAAPIGGAFLATSAFISYFRSQDPVNECIDNTQCPPFQLSIPITVKLDGFPAAPQELYQRRLYIHPVYTVAENVSQLVYSRLYDFKLGHYLYCWLGNDLLQHDTKVYINGPNHSGGHVRTGGLEQRDQIRIEFVSRN